jgi:cysteine desulfurase
MSQPVYLDYSAATPVKPEVAEAMRPYLSQEFYNPSAIYLAAKHAKRQLDGIRQSAAVQLGAKPAEIIFTAGATEANNLAIQGLGRQYPGAEILISAVEHESVRAPAELFDSREVPVDEHGRILLNKLSNLISDKTLLVSVMLVNNEVGTVQPLSEVAALIGHIRRQRREKGNELPIYLHTDAAQAGNYFDLHVSRLGVDLMSVNGGKIYGPKQSGILYVKAGLKLWPLIVGGGQEFGLRSGTESLAAAAGLAKALDLAQNARGAESKRVTSLRDYFESRITELIPGAVTNGTKNHRSPHISNITFDGVDNERLLMELDERGVQCAAGSACSASSDEPSHVLMAMGLSREMAQSTLRFSLGAQTTKDQLDKAVSALRQILQADR